MGGNQNDGGNGGEQPRPEVPNVAPNLAVTDFQRIISAIPFFGTGGDGNLGQTSFDSHRLNQMIDLIASARPADMEHAGDALWRAGGAIRKAADELHRHMGKVQWEGESGNAFRTWTTQLVENSEKLAKYSENAGTQIKASGAGLATVQKSMPPRDTRLVQMDVKDIPAPAQVKGNATYDEAVKVEEDRQEAINQMNRLGSYYTVSNDIMAGQEPPTFQAMPNVGIPKPPRDASGTEELTTTSSPGSVDSGGAQAQSVSAAVGQPAASGPQDPVVVPDRAVGTDIDSVAPPALVEPAPTAPVTPVTGGQGPGPNAAPPGFMGPVGMPPGGLRTTPGISGAPRAVGQSPVGRPGMTGKTGQVGRPYGMGQAGALGRSAGTPSGSAMGRGYGMGQAGALGRSAGTASGSAMGRGATMPGRMVGRSGGIIGGTPSAKAARALTPRLPRGTVIGSEQSAMGRGPLGGGPRAGMTGGPGGAGGSKSGARRLAFEKGGVVGTPRSGVSAQARAVREFTPGGSGLVRSSEAGRAGAVPGRAGMVPRGGNPSGREPEIENGSRPDYLVEDEETWATRRHIVPPVVE
jgi:uncharacterized protein YukE